jgi:hypothetical protein
MAPKPVPRRSTYEYFLPVASSTLDITSSMAGGPWGSRGDCITAEVGVATTCPPLLAIGSLLGYCDMGGG